MKNYQKLNDKKDTKTHCFKSKVNSQKQHAKCQFIKSILDIITPFHDKTMNKAPVYSSALLHPK